MSNVVSTGYYNDKLSERLTDKCKKSPTGEHEPLKKGQWPSNWFECKHCKETLGYTK